MDDIDRAKIGRKEEKLVGWDHIHKESGINLPAMKAKKTDKKSRLYSKSDKNDEKWLWLRIVVILGITGIIIAKLIGLW